LHHISGDECSRDAMNFNAHVIRHSFGKGKRSILTGGFAAQAGGQHALREQSGIV